MRKIALVLGFFAWFGPAEVHAAPSSVSFAGRLTTAAGSVEGAVNVTFSIFDAQTGGASVWSDSIAVTAEKGLVFATLGRASNELDETVFTGAARFLEIVVQGETLSPRLPILSTPYAVRAGGADSADLLGTLAPNDLQLRVTGACPAGQSIRTINASGTVICEPDDNTTYSSGTGVSVSGTTIGLSTAGCAAGEVWKFNGTSFACVPDSSFTSCTWELDIGTVVSSFLDAVCPSGKHLISGGCLPAGGTVLYAFPHAPAGSPITSVSNWHCEFSNTATSHRAYALCCGID